MASMAIALYSTETVADSCLSTAAAAWAPASVFSASVRRNAITRSLVARPLLTRVIWLMNSVRYGPRSSMNVLMRMRSRVQRRTSRRVCWMVLNVGG